jgi:hypothetical protein
MNIAASAPHYEEWRPFLNVIDGGIRAARSSE